MKRPLVNKLGTALNTIGSLGVGYYVASLNILSDPLLRELTLQQHLQFLGALALLVVGLILRINDLRTRKHEVKQLETLVKAEDSQVQVLRDEITHLTDKKHWARELLSEATTAQENDIRRIVEEEVQKKISEEPRPKFIPPQSHIGKEGGPKAYGPVKKY